MTLNIDFMEMLSANWNQFYSQLISYLLIISYCLMIINRLITLLIIRLLYNHPHPFNYIEIDLSQRLITVVSIDYPSDIHTYLPLGEDQTLALMY